MEYNTEKTAFFMAHVKVEATVTVPDCIINTLSSQGLLNGTGAVSSSPNKIRKHGI